MSKFKIEFFHLALSYKNHLQKIKSDTRTYTHSLTHTHTHTHTHKHTLVRQLKR